MHCQSTLSPLRLARILAQKTQFEIARRARMSPARLSLIERGHDDPTASERAALAAALGAPEAQIFPARAADTEGDHAA